MAPIYFTCLNYINGISVVIPNYNGSVLLPLILPPLFEALKNAQLSYEVIISDDCSTDNSVSFLQEHYPEIILLQMGMILVTIITTIATREHYYE